jgi:flagellar hook-associated protein 2
MAYVSSLSSGTSVYTSISTSGAITFSGLGNGTDFSEIIDATVEAESYKLDAYEEDQEEKEAIVELLETLSDLMDDLNETLEGLDEIDEFLPMTTTVEDAFTATADGDATPGTHTIVVNQLAQADVWVDTAYGFSSENEVLASSATTFTLSYAGKDITLDIAAGTTIEGLVSAINTSSSTTGKVTASLVYDGESYYFTLSGDDTGADNAIVIKDTGTLSGMSASGFTNTLTAQDCRFKVDGFPVGDDAWISRDTNVVDDVLTGVTLTFTDTTDSAGETLTVNYDTGALEENIETFLAEVNQIILEIQTLTGRLDQDYENGDAVSTDTDEDDEDDEDDDIVIKSSTLDAMYSQIKSILSSSGLGFKAYDADTDSGDLFSTLSQLGISTDTEEGSDTFGQLQLDTDTLEEALDADPAAVAALFSVNDVAESDSDALQVISLIKTVTAPGNYQVEYTVENGALVSATINGEQAQVSGWTILGIDDDSTGLYLQVVDQTDGDHSGSVRVKQGKIGQLAEAISDMTADETGTLAILIRSYEQGIDDLDDRIYYESARLDALETKLTSQYATLDETLSYYTNLESSLSSLVESLSSD